MKNAINQLPKRAEFIKILSASFISQSGSHILTLALATFVFISSGSPVKSSLVFVFAFFPSILVSSQLGSWIDRSISRSFLVYIEILSILASVLCGIVVFYKLPLSLLCIVLGLRSILTFTSRTADSKWVKCITDLRFQASRMRLMFFISFLSTGCAGILAALALQKYSFIWVVLLDIITYIFGILFLVSLQDISQKYRNKLSNFTTKQNDLITTIKTIFIRPKIRTHFILVCLSQAIFQGAYCSLISVLPILRFDLGSSGVGMFQVATSIGIILGFIVNWYWSYLLASTKKFTSRMFAIFMIAILCLFLANHTNSLLLSLLFFFGFNFAGECIWLYNNTEFFQASPTTDVAKYQFTLTACAALLMSIFTLFYAFTLEKFGLANGTTVFLLISIILMIIAFGQASQDCTESQQQ